MKNISLLDLKREYQYLKNEIDHAIRVCLEYQHWILGPEVKELEKKVAEYIGTRHAVGVASGTDALLLSLRALAIKLKGKEYFDRDDLIITTPFTFTATGDAILRAGATPVFVDIDPESYNINPKQIREYLSAPVTQHIQRPIGIIPVHLYGLSCNMSEIMEIAREYNLFVLEDVAQAFGGIWKDKKLGSIGTVGAFSFFPSKNLGGFGDGGMVVTEDDQLAELVRMLLKHGGKDKYNVDHIGYNSRLDTLQAAVLLAKFNYIDEFNERRRGVAQIYTQELSGIDGFTLPFTPMTEIYHVYNQYTVRVLQNKRDDLQERLKAQGVSTAIYYPVPLHRMKLFQERCGLTGDLRVAETVAKEVLSLPIEPLFTEEEVSHICKIMRKVIC